ncbi:MAG TPA: hypothetical protein VNQ76_16805 [Planctomicrobium sp.]|nr:hypothetical protein [Planctomicrobium sp.]
MTHHSIEPASPLFTSEEHQQFLADDAKAGSAMSKILILFFLYTVVAVTGVIFVTQHYIQQAISH